jgi:phage baseplate assembly protein W
MPDLRHQFGADLAVGPTGDLATAAGAVLGQQRVLRRLLTNAGDYVWHPGYGAGLAQFVGQPADAARIRAVIRSQIFKESAVARTPEPVIEVQSCSGGMVFVRVQYADAASGETQVLRFTLGDGA